MLMGPIVRAPGFTLTYLLRLAKGPSNRPHARTLGPMRKNGTYGQDPIIGLTNLACDLSL